MFIEGTKMAFPDCSSSQKQIPFCSFCNDEKAIYLMDRFPHLLPLLCKTLKINCHPSLIITMTISGKNEDIINYKKATSYNFITSFQCR